MSYDDRYLRGVGGWLAFLFIILAFFTPIAVGISIFAVLRDPAMAAAYGEAWPILQGIALFIAAVNVAGAWYLAWRINSVHEPATVPVVIGGLWAINVGLLLVEVVAVAVAAGIGLGDMLGASAVDLGRGVVFATVWTLYMLKSRRVANTYGRSEDEVSEVFA